MSSRLPSPQPIFGSQSSPEYRPREIFLCVVGILLCFALQFLTDRVDEYDQYDSRQYIGAAYNLAHHGVFNESPSATTPEPGAGREPLYGILLSAFFLFDPAFENVTLKCLAVLAGCGNSTYTKAVFANFALIAATGLLIFWVVRHLTGQPTIALISGYYLWLNVFAYASMAQLISDPLAMFLVAVFLAFATSTVARKSILGSAATGVALGLLTLTKGIVLYFFVLAATILAVVTTANWIRARGTKGVLLAMVFIAAYFATVAPWMVRNHSIIGDYVVSAGRTGWVLGVRETYNDMTLEEYGLAFLYWTRVVGDRLVLAVGLEENAKRFDVSREDSFFIVGHQAHSARSKEIMERTGMPESEARAEATREIVSDMIDKFPKHLAVTIPLFWRGIMVDIFMPVTIPVFAYMTVYWFRRRVVATLPVAAFGWFSLLLYPLVSLNIPRYQMIAVPSLGIALGFAVALLWLKRKRTWETCD